MRSLGRRRRLLLDDWLQSRLLGFNVLYFFVFVLTLALLVLTPSVATLFSGDATLGQKEAAATELLALQRRVPLALAAVFVLFVLHSLFISHRLAGPLLRFRRMFQQIGDGQLTLRVSTRRHDYLVREAKALNDMVVGLGERVARVKDQAAAAQLAGERLQRAAAGGAAITISQCADDVLAAIEELQRSLAAISTPPRAS